jgi:mannose-6-phosphate isomerase-like protein (cupin superfamily)
MTTQPYVLQPGQGESVAIGPASMLVKTVNGDSGDRLFVAEHVMPPMFAGPASHVHDEMDHAFYILEGILRLVVTGEEHLVAAGSFVFVPRATVHSFGNASELPTRFLEINVPGGFERYYRDLAKAFPIGAAIDPERMQEIQQRHGIRPV